MQFFFCMRKPVRALNRFHPWPADISHRSWFGVLLVCVQNTIYNSPRSGAFYYVEVLNILLRVYASFFFFFSLCRGSLSLHCSLKQLEHENPPERQEGRKFRQRTCTWTRCVAQGHNRKAYYLISCVFPCLFSKHSASPSNIKPHLPLISMGGFDWWKPPEW